MLFSLHKCLFLSSLVISGLLSGCATITGSSTQQVFVDARDCNNQPIQGVNCKLSNDKGTWYTLSPNAATVQKIGKRFIYRC